jgi:hypothetical protein
MPRDVFHMVWGYRMALNKIERALETVETVVDWSVIPRED